MVFTLITILKNKKEFYSDHKYHTMTCSNSAKMTVALKCYNLSTHRYKYYNMGEHITVAMSPLTVILFYYVLIIYVISSNIYN